MPDILRTYSQSAHQKIEEFKIIELKKQGQPDLDMACDDNIRYSQEFINIHGVMVEKPFVYKKTYVEVRGENRSDMVGHKLTGLARLYGAQYESLYISMAVEDFYWAQFQYELGNKKRVVNSCLMPFLILIAVFHIMIVQNRRSIIDSELILIKHVKK